MCSTRGYVSSSLRRGVFALGQNEAGLARVADEEHGVEPKHRFNLRQLTGCWTGVDAAQRMSTDKGNTQSRQVVKYGLQDWYQVRPRCPVFSLSRALPLVESLMLLALSLSLTHSLTHPLTHSLSRALSLPPTHSLAQVRWLLKVS